MIFHWPLSTVLACSERNREPENDCLGCFLRAQNFKATVLACSVFLRYSTQKKTLTQEGDFPKGYFKMLKPPPTVETQGQKGV